MALRAASISSSLSYPRYDKLRETCMAGAVAGTAEPGFFKSLLFETGLSQIRHLAWIAAAELAKSARLKSPITSVIALISLLKQSRDRGIGQKIA